MNIMTSEKGVNSSEYRLDRWGRMDTGYDEKGEEKYFKTMPHKSPTGTIKLSWSNALKCSAKQMRAPEPR